MCRVSGPRHVFPLFYFYFTLPMFICFQPPAPVARSPERGRTPFWTYPQPHVSTHQHPLVAQARNATEADDEAVREFEAEAVAGGTGAGYSRYQIVHVFRAYFSKQHLLSMEKNVMNQYI